MAAVKAADVDRAIKSRGPGICVLLFYGPDAGQISERARAAAEAAVSDPTDPFQLIKLTAEDLADHPGKLVEEATTYGLFGEKRVVLVRAAGGGRTVVSPVAACLDGAPDGTLVVVEAGELSKGAPLRALCEKSPRALSLPCYGDAERDIASIVTEALAAEGLAIDRETRDLLIESLGGDRLASRGELAKLALYCRGRDRVTSEDIMAVVSDVSSIGIDDALDAAFEGRGADVEPRLRQLSANGIGAPAILSLAVRHALALLAARGAMDEGADPEAAMRSFGNLHFRRKDTVKRQLRRWRSPTLSGAVELLQTATLTTRRQPALTQPILAQALLRVAATR